MPSSNGHRPVVSLVDYVAGNVRSLTNALARLGFEVEFVRTPEAVRDVQVRHLLPLAVCLARLTPCQVLIVPGVGHFGHCMTQLAQSGFLAAIRGHIDSGKPFMGICVGLQALFQGSCEDPDVHGFGIVPSRLVRFDDATKAVPHIGWNDASTGGGDLYDLSPESKYYYVHSYMAPYHAGELESEGWTVATATYGHETFVGALARGNVYATQFHPEKSGAAGMRTLRAFLDGSGARSLGRPAAVDAASPRGGLTRRVIACLDVRANDQGDLVVTKGDQYDVREKSDDRSVRNLGKPVDLATRYYQDGADEVTFLNITSFRDCPLADQPMLQVLRRACGHVFVPMTVGGGIRDTVDTDGTKVSALEVATLYFQSGADKVSIGSDAVLAAEEYYAHDRTLFGNTAIEQISRAYGNQAVVVSVDPKRVYVPKEDATRHNLVRTRFPGPRGESYCWYACTIKGGRETRDLDVVELVRAVEDMGAGEILLNCIDRDGTNSGFDLELIDQVKTAVKIPVIASSGAGSPAHFQEVFDKTKTDAALGAGMFHRGEYTVRQVKQYLQDHGLTVRRVEQDVWDDA